MSRLRLALPCSVAILCLSAAAPAAVDSAELYTGQSYTFGRFEARIQFAAGDGVVSSFFLWKDGSEKADVFWNELDFEKVAAECRLETNALFGIPVRGSVGKHGTAPDYCGEFHTYAYEWTPDYIAWFVDDAEIRRIHRDDDTAGVVDAFSENAMDGMQIRFNIWPGDASFGGNFSPSILPVHQRIDWVQYSSYTEEDGFELEWREDFDSDTLPAGFLTGSWASPKNKSTHRPANVTFSDGHAILSLTDDGTGGSSGAGGQAGAPPSKRDDDGGCRFAAPRKGESSQTLGLMALALAAAVFSRRLGSRILGRSARISSGQ